MSATEAHNIQIDIDLAKARIKRRDHLIRLMSNRDFKAVILEGYFKEEAIRLVEYKAAPSAQTVEGQEGIIRSIDSIGQLKQFFNAVWVLGDQMERSVEANEEELSAMEMEEGE